MTKGQKRQKEGRSSRGVEICVPKGGKQHATATEAVPQAFVGESMRRGLKAVSGKRTGRKPKYPFSGLLRCGTCGARFVIAARA
jgi:hypothetical protein